MSGALLRYRVMAYVTGVVLAFMTVVGLPFKYLMGQSATWYSVGWVGHGWLYVLYVLAAIDLATRCRWGFVRSVLVLLAGTVPFMSFVAEHYVTKDVKARLAAAAGPSDADGPQGGPGTPAGVGDVGPG